MAQINITYDGRPAITTAQAAARYGLSMDAMRKALNRATDVHALPEMLDGRTLLYFVDDLDRAIPGRPGRGANLRKPAAG